MKRNDKITVIGISGKRGSGKDTLADAMLVEGGYVKLPFARVLKEMCKTQFDMTENEVNGVMKEEPLLRYPKADTGYYTPREIMIKVGQFYRSIDSLYWVKKVFKIIENAQGTKYSKFVISDVRFKNEADYILEKGGYLVRLERKPELNIYKGEIIDPSETELDNYTRFDKVLTADDNINKIDLEVFARDIDAFTTIIL